ncbi:hypothetical protein B0H12DRAFT_1244111 [Mycena haematopus]|nr:hypothetical protein B0H12DRAFT_1244111 [Mycena haematopus]
MRPLSSSFRLTEPFTLIFHPGLHLAFAFYSSGSPAFPHLRPLTIYFLGSPLVVVHSPAFTHRSVHEKDHISGTLTIPVLIPFRIRRFHPHLVRPFPSPARDMTVPSQDDVDLHYHPYAEPDGGENDQKGLQGKTTRDVRANRRTGKRRREGEGEDENEDKDKEKRGKRRRQARSGMATSRDPKAGRDDEGGAAGPSRPPRRGPGPPKRDSGPPATRSRTRTTDNSKKQRQATDHIGPKKCDVVDIPDLDVLKPHDIEMMRGIDRLLQGGTYSAGSNPDWYPGFSQIAQLAYEYKQAHPAVTDPGRARIALISERVEE